jgi:hypothetical protein
MGTMHLPHRKIRFGIYTNCQAKVYRIWDIYKLPFKCIIGQIYTMSFKLVADELGDDDVEIDKIVKILNELG